MTGIVAELLTLLDLERLETDLFRGFSPEQSWPRVFGGQVVGQALVAAARTVPSTRPPHSLHAYFLLGGDPKVPIIYEVERIRDGGSFTTRRVKAVQHGRAIFAMSVSFHETEPGLEHAAAMPEVPPPESLPDTAALVAQAGSAIPIAVARARATRVRDLLTSCAERRQRGQNAHDGATRRQARSLRGRTSPSCATEATRRPDRSKICPRAKASAPDALGLSWA